MGNLTWKLRQWINQLMPLALIAALGWGGYSLYKNGVMRRGLKPALTQTLRQIPVFGTYFKKHTRSYSYGKRNSRGRKHYRRGRQQRQHRRYHR